MRHIAKPVNADASWYRARLLPCSTVPFISLAASLRISMHFYAAAQRSLTLPSCCLSEHCRAHLCLASAQLCRAAIRIAFAGPRRTQPLPSRTVPYSALTTPYGAVLCCCSEARSLAIALRRKALPLQNTTVHRLTPALPDAAEPLLVSAQPCNAAAPLRRRRAIRYSASPSPGYSLPPAVALLGTSPLSRC